MPRFHTLYCLTIRNGGANTIFYSAPPGSPVKRKSQRIAGFLQNLCPMHSDQFQRSI